MKFWKFLFLCSALLSCFAYAQDQRFCVVSNNIATFVDATLPLGNAVLRSVNLDPGHAPGSVAFGSGKFCITNLNTQSVLITDMHGTSIRKFTNIAGPGVTKYFEFNAGQKFFLVIKPNSSPGSLAVIDALANSQLADITLTASNPRDIDFTSGVAGIVSENLGGVGSIAVYNGTTVGTQTAVAGNPIAIAAGRINATTSGFFVVTRNSPVVRFFDTTATAVAAANFATSTNHVAVAFGNDRCCVVCQDGTVRIQETVANTPIAETTLPNQPFAVAFGNSFFAVISRNNPNVDVFDSSTGTVTNVGFVAAGTATAVTYDSSNRRFAITYQNANGSTLKFVDVSAAPTANGTSVNVGANPVAAVFGDFAPPKFLAANTGSGNVSVFTPGLAPATVTTGAMSGFVSIAFTHNIFASSNNNAGNTTVINALNNTVLGAIGGPDPTRSAFGGEFLGITHNLTNSARFYYLGSVPPSLIANITINNCFGIAFGNNVFAVTQSGANTRISFVDATNFSVISTRLLPLNGGVPEIVFGNNRFGVLVGDNSILFIDATTLQDLARVNVGNTATPRARSLAFDGVRNFAVVNTDQNENSVSVVNSDTLAVVNTAANSFNFSNISDFIGLTFITSGGGFFAVPDPGNNVLRLVDVNGNIVHTVPVGTSPRSVAFDAVRNVIAVANFTAGTVTLLDASVLPALPPKVIDTVNVGTNPWGIVFGDSSLPF